MWGEGTFNDDREAAYEIVAGVVGANHALVAELLTTMDRDRLLGVIGLYATLIAHTQYGRSLRAVFDSLLYERPT